MTIFEEIKKSGVEYAHHCSDLYFPKNKTTMEIVLRYDDRFITTFKDAISGKTWYDVAFAYDPYWEEHIKGWKEL